MVTICLNISITTEVITTSALIDTSAEISEISFFENQSRSIAVYDEAISQYRSISSRGREEVVTYSDDFAGVFIDDKGFLNIALVQLGQNELTFNGQVLNQLHQFSYNYLQEIKEAVVDVMTTFGIHMVGVDEKANRVSVYISEASKIENISNFIMEQTWFDDTAINYIVESAAVQHNPSYGGESISAAGFSGTICVAAIDNTTGRLGILTNEHVVPTGTASNYRGHWNGSTFSANVALGTALSGQHEGTIDASFIPYTNQGNWEISPYGRHDTTTYTNIRLGNNDQIVQGRAVRKIGQTSGITNGTITNANMTITLNYGTPENPNIQAITNVFRYSNESLGGDSGGPVYFNDGTDLHLIGMNFAGPSNPATSTFGIACRIQNVMNILEVTPITNDSFNTSNLTSTTVSLNGINFNPTGEFVIPNQLNGRIVTQIGSSAFTGQSQLTKITIPSSVTTIGNNAFQNTNNAPIYLEGRTSAPNTFDINWNSSGNPVYLNGNLCTHTSTTLMSINYTQHGHLCNTCRTFVSESNHNHNVEHIPLGTAPSGIAVHSSYCRCGHSVTVPCVSKVPHLPGDTVICTYCGQEFTNPLFMITLPNGESFVSNAPFTYDMFKQLAEHLEISYQYEDFVLSARSSTIDYEYDINLASILPSRKETLYECCE